VVGSRGAESVASRVTSRAGIRGERNAQMFGQRHRVYNARPLLVFRSSRFHRQALPQS